MKSNGIVNTTPLWEDILSVVGSSDKKRNLHVSAIFHTEKEDFPVMKVLLVENKRDYYKSTGEYGAISVYMSMGDYIYRLIPFRDHLEISLKTTCMDDSGKSHKDNPPTVVRYKALINFNINPFPSSENISNRSIADLNLLPPVTATLELQDRCEELLRLKTLDGSFSNKTTEQILKGAWLHEANKVKVDGKDIVQILQIDPPDNSAVYGNLVIPNGTLLRDIPGFLQEKGKGVYTGGIGSFFQRYNNKPGWFVYPLYKKERFDQDRFKLVIYAVPEGKMPGMNRTYRTEGKITYIAATGEKKMADTSKNTDLNHGTGFRMPDAEAFMLKPVEIGPDGIKANRRRLVHEVSHRERKDQINSANMQSSSANSFKQYSDVLSREFSAVAVTWENSNPDLLYPGMPVKYVYMDRGEYIESKGTLVTAYSVTKLIGNPLEESNHAVSTQLNILVEPQSFLPVNDKKTQVGEYR